MRLGFIFTKILNCQAGITISIDKLSYYRGGENEKNIIKECSYN